MPELRRSGGVPVLCTLYNKLVCSQKSRAAVCESSESSCCHNRKNRSYNARCFAVFITGAALFVPCYTHFLSATDRHAYAFIFNYPHRAGVRTLLIRCLRNLNA